MYSPRPKSSSKDKADSITSSLVVEQLVSSLLHGAFPLLQAFGSNRIESMSDDMSCMSWLIQLFPFNDVK
jgi:hypothetical protein